MHVHYSALRVVSINLAYKALPLSRSEFNSKAPELKNKCLELNSIQDARLDQKSAQFYVSEVHSAAHFIHCKFMIMHQFTKHPSLSSDKTPRRWKRGEPNGCPLQIKMVFGSVPAILRWSDSQTSQKECFYKGVCLLLRLRASALPLFHN